MVELKNKKILVTGGAGFLGKHIVRNLITKRGVPEKNIRIPRASETDLRIKSVAETVIKDMDIVIHCAALTGGVGFHQEHPGEVFYSNVIMGAQLMELARLAGVSKFLSIGTATEYPKDAPVPLRETDLWNGRPEESQIAYSMAKNMLLAQAQAYRQEYGFNAIHLLMSTMYGPGDNWQGTYVIPSLTRQIIKVKAEGGPYLQAWGTGKATRDFLYIEDAAEGVVLATELYELPDPVNIGSGVETPMRELITSLAGLLGLQAEIRWDPTKPEGQLRKVLDISRARALFGFDPKVTLATGLQKTVEDYKKTRI